MKAKVASAITIGCVILVAVSVSLFIILMGMKNGGYNYVKLECGMEIEFVTDTKDRVISYKPLNEKARLVVADNNLKNKDISKAVDLVLNNSLKMGYLTLNEKEFNVIKITTVPGLTQALEVHVYKAVNKFLVENEVMAVIVENQNDMEMIKEGKKLNISANKLALVNSVVNSNSSLTKKQMKSKMEDELIDLILSFHENYEKVNPITEDEIAKKEKLIKDNEEEYNKHIKSIDKKKAGAFVKKLQDLNKKEQTKYELEYSKLVKGE